MQLGQVFFCLWKLSALAGGSSPQNPAVFSFHVSCFPFSGAFESSVKPCSLPGEQEGGGGYQLLTRHEICSHWPLPLASSLSLQATLSLVTRGPCCAHTHKLCCASVKLPLLHTPDQELPPHLPGPGQKHLLGFSSVPLTPWASIGMSPHNTATRSSLPHVECSALAGTPGQHPALMRSPLAIKLLLLIEPH